MTPSGIEPATFRFVEQYLNHCATVVPYTVILVLPLYLSVHLNAKMRGRYHYLHMLRLLYIGIFLRAYLPISIFAINVYNSIRSLCEFRFSSAFRFSSRFEVR
jgi:hypothetical protein